MAHLVGIPGVLAKGAQPVGSPRVVPGRRVHRRGPGAVLAAAVPPSSRPHVDCRQGTRGEREQGRTDACVSGVFTTMKYALVMKTCGE